MEALLNILISYFKERWDPILWIAIIWLLFAVKGLQTSLNNHIPSQINHVKEDITRVEKQGYDERKRLEDRLNRIDDKLDRLIDYIIKEK